MKKFSFAPGVSLGTKNFFSSNHPEKKILLYIGKWINGKFSISGLSGEILANQVDFWEVALGGQFSKFVKNFQMSPNPNGMNDFEIAEYVLEIIFSSKLKIRVGCHGH